MEYIAFDCHKKYTYVEDKKGRVHWKGKMPGIGRRFSRISSTAR